MSDVLVTVYVYCFFFKQKTAYEMRISDWSSDVCSSDLDARIEQCPPFADQDRIGIPDAPPRCSPISKCNIMNERVLRFDELGLTVGPASCGHEDAHRGTDILKNANMPAKCRRRRRRKVLRTHDFRPFAGDEFSECQVCLCEPRLVRLKRPRHSPRKIGRAA